MKEIKAQQSINDIWTSGLEISYESFSNWADQINRTQPFLVVHPRTSQQVASIVTWAYSVGKYVRVQGHRHSYPPITVSEQDDPSKVILLDFKRHMTRMRMGSVGINAGPGPHTSSRMATVITETGATMESFMTFAERNGYGIVMSPIIGGDATVGGVLAIGGHGAAIPALNEPLVGPGYSFGSVSNLIVEMKAIVWDPHTRRYVVKIFTRSDPEIAALIVHVGRAIITEVSLMVGQNYNMRCVSRIDVPAWELYAHPNNATGLRTFDALSDIAGRVDIIWYPFAENPWLKIWEVSERKPDTAKVTTGPYNYQFNSTLDNPQTPGPVFGPQTVRNLERGLTQTRTWDIWGPSKDTILYYNRTKSPLVYSGFVILTNRRNMQQIFYEVGEFYRNLLNEYGSRGQYPIDQYIKMRACGLDNPEDTRIPGAVAPILSPTGPMRSRPDYDVGVWMNTLTTTRRPFSDEFMRRFEEWAYTRYNGRDGLARPEWSKNWGHTNQAPFTSSSFIHEIIPRVFGIEEWNHAIGTLDKLDPHHVISNELLRTMMVPYSGGGGGGHFGVTNPRYDDNQHGSFLSKFPRWDSFLH